MAAGKPGVSTDLGTGVGCESPRRDRFCRSAARPGAREAIAALADRAAASMGEAASEGLIGVYRGR
jgi:hypothetical protein